MAFGISLALLLVIGVAVQRGNTCTVVAFDDLIHRRSPNRLLAIAYCWLLVAGGLTLLTVTTGFRPSAQLFPVTVWSVVGGVLLGAGAVVNGACTTGTIARIGSGEYAFGMTIAGFFLGCLAAPHIFGRATEHTPGVPTATSLDHPVIALAGLAFVVAVTARRLVTGSHESVAEFLRSAWDPRTALFVIAVLFVALVQIDGPWAYTDMLGDLAKGMTADNSARLAFLAALLVGAIIGGRSLRGAKLIGPLAPRIVRCLLGGFVMGVGFSVAPGAFDGMTLFGQPLLLPFAWVVMGASYIAIVAGLIYLRSGLAAWVTARRG